MDLDHWCHGFFYGLVISLCVQFQSAIGDTTEHNTHPTLPAQRIITLAPHATELVQAIGAEDLLVAAAAFSPNLPPHIPRISTFGGLDREHILQLAPDLVIAWTSGNRPSDLAWLTQQGIPVLHSDPQTLPELAAHMRIIGQRIGRLKQADIAAAQWIQALHVTSCSTDTPTEIYLQIWPRPAMSVGGQHWLNDVLRYAGMRNTYADIKRGIFAVEAEALMSKQALLRLSGNDTVKNQPNSLWVPHISRPGPALIQVIQQLCHRDFPYTAPPSSHGIAP